MPNPNEQAFRIGRPAALQVNRSLQDVAFRSVSLACRFHPMQTRHERRRRVLSDEAPQGISGKDKKRSGRRRRFYAAAARRDQQPRITDVVPMRYRTYSLLAALGLAIIGLMGFLTLLVAFRDGVDVLVIVSGIVLAPLAVGVIGALTESSGDE